MDDGELVVLVALSVGATVLACVVEPQAATNIDKTNTSVTTGTIGLLIQTTLMNLLRCSPIPLVVNSSQLEIPGSLQWYSRVAEFTKRTHQRSRD